MQRVWRLSDRRGVVANLPAAGVRGVASTAAAGDPVLRGRTPLPADRLALLRSPYAGAIAVMRDDSRPAKTPLQERGWSLANRFDTHRDMILAFLHDLSIPFTNNAAERAIRPVKVKQRAAGCWRTLEGLTDFAIIWSYLSTAAKHGLDHLDVLVELFTTGPWLPPDPAPG